jgi:hypothetical protein
VQPLGSSQHFMEPEGSLPSSQGLSTCTYTEPDQSSPQHLPKHWLTLNILHKVISQKTAPFITAVVRTSNPTTQMRILIPVLTSYLTA